MAPKKQPGRASRPPVLAKATEPIRKSTRLLKSVLPLRQLKPQSAVPPPLTAANLAHLELAQKEQAKAKLSLTELPLRMANPAALDKPADAQKKPATRAQRVARGSETASLSAAAPSRATAATETPRNAAQPAAVLANRAPTDAPGAATPSTAMMAREATKPPPKTSEYNDFARVLKGTTILVTGAETFVGQALLYRLLKDPDLTGVKRVLALIPAKTDKDAWDKLPLSLKHHTGRTEFEHLCQPDLDAPLVVITGDSAKLHLDLDFAKATVRIGAENAARIYGAVMNADIMIHAAGLERNEKEQLITYDNRQLKSAEMTARFSLAHKNIKTYVHLSTVQESHGRIRSEDSVQAMFTDKAGRAHLEKATRIVRVVAPGPAALWPFPGWGYDRQDLPLVAALRTAGHIKPKRQEEESAYHDVLPVDLAVNQILALTAAAHASHSLPRSSLNHPANLRGAPDTPTFPVYHVASGLPPALQLHRLTIAKVNADKGNPPSVETDIKAKREADDARRKAAVDKVREQIRVEDYKTPGLDPQHFDVSSTRAVLGLEPGYEVKEMNPAKRRKIRGWVQKEDEEALDAWDLPYPVPYGYIEGGFVNPSEESVAASEVIPPSKISRASSRLSNSDESVLSLIVAARPESVRLSRVTEWVLTTAREHPLPAPLNNLSLDTGAATPPEATGNPSPSAAATALALPTEEWIDTPLDCGSLHLDVGKVMEDWYGPLTPGGPDSVGWTEYLNNIRDAIDRIPVAKKRKRGR